MIRIGSKVSTGIGFGYNFPNFIGPGGNISSEMRSISPSAYIRIPFTHRRSSIRSINEFINAFRRCSGRIP